MKNPKFKILKPVRFGINQPGPDILTFIDDQVGEELIHDDVTTAVAKVLEDAGYIKILEHADADADDEEEVVLTATEKIVADVIAGGANKNDKKDLLEVWALDELKIDIDKRKSLDFLIEFAIEEYDKANG